MQSNAIELDLDAFNVSTVMYVQSRSLQPHFMPGTGPRGELREKQKYLSDNARKVGQLLGRSARVPSLP